MARQIRPGLPAARRLVEKGVRYVEVAKGGWDMPTTSTTVR
ncbi:MAG: hypothetical protein R3F13_02365 [Prosthecobacter sp.]